jgi:3-deoxy-manno-octulosonate cytidylyltransferase (CMP-KDO synthetase)
MIEFVYRRTLRAHRVDRVLVATDDERIAGAVRAFGGEAYMTRADHQSGTDRVAEVAATLKGAGVVVNVQGDEPLIHPGDIDAAAGPLLSGASVEMTTIAVPIPGVEDFLDSNVVKVVVSKEGDALYFSRAPLPHMRDLMGGTLDPAGALGERWAEIRPRPMKHLGLYAYRREYLTRLSSLPPSGLEMAERLEQLRALEDGARIRVVEVENDSIGVDTPGDLARLSEDTALREKIEQEIDLWQNISS